MAGYIGGLVGEVYGIGERAQSISANPYLIALAVLIGVLTSIVAALIPSRNAARVDPVKALQKGKYQSLSVGENRIRRFLALAFATIAVGCVVSDRGGFVLYGGYAAAIVAAILMTPAVTLWLSKGLRGPLKWLRPVEGALAADSLIQAPRRTSGAVAALMLSIGLVIALGGMARSSYTSILRWAHTWLNPDLYVTTSQSLTTRSYRFGPEVGKAVAETPGVETVQAVRSARIIANGSPVMLVAVDLASLRSKVHPVAIEGNVDEMYREASAGRGVIISDNLALLQNRHKGDLISIPTPKGTLTLPIVGAVIDYSDQLGAVLIDLSLYQRYWNDDTVNFYRVYARPGISAMQVRQSILDRLSNQSHIFVLTSGDVRAYIIRITDQWFGLTYVQILVAVLVAILGIVNTLTVSITDRRREMGVLRAVGAVRPQIRHTVWIESLAIGLVGVMLGLAFGAIQLYYGLEITRRDIAGLRLAYDYPFLISLGLLPVILGAAFISALGPGESAVRGSLVEALEYE